MASVRVLVAGLLLVIVPAIASAQRETFVQSAQALALAAQSDDGGTAVASAVTRMRTALAEWDRSLKARQAEVERELTGATPPRRFQLHVELGVAYRARGRLADAVREFAAAADAQPASSDVQLLRGLTLESASKPDEAARAFHAAWSRDPGNALKAYRLLQYAAQLDPGDVARARAVLDTTYDALRTAPPPASVPFVILDALPDTLSRTPVVGDVRTGEGLALLAAGQYSEGLALLSANHADHSGDDSRRRFRQAQADEKETRVSDARAGYTASLKGTLAGRSAIYVAIGRLAQVEGDAPAAMDAFAHAVRLNPNDQTMRQELAGAYASAGRIDDAFGELIAGLLINPANATLHAAIGQLRLDSGKPAEAVPAFTRALELSPDHFEVRYALATALARSGKAADAATQLALFEQTRRQMLERRRREIQQEVEREDAIRRGLTKPGEAP